MNYGVLKGKAIEFKRDDDDKPHSELLMKADGVQYRIAINVRSSRGPTHKRLVEYLIKHDMNHPVLDHARSLASGWNSLTDGVQDGAAIDYIRSNMFRATEMKPITHLEPGENNDLFEFIEDMLNRAIEDKDALVYAFGDRWGPEDHQEDTYFHFTPGNGVHMIHMNQGGAGDNFGTFRDGALIIDFPAMGTNSALFIKFQNQIWHTSETDASPLQDAPQVDVIEIPDTGTVRPWPVVAADSPYYLARIIAAIVNPQGADQGLEKVTVLNTSSETLDMAGWQILDRMDNAETISGTLEPGDAKVFLLSGKGAQLGNNGGTITLLNAQGLKVDGVAYTKEQASVVGRPVVF